MPRTTPSNTREMPSGIPYIIGNEAAERFSFYGMRAILVVFMTKYLWLMGDTAGTPMSELEANSKYHMFNTWVYFTPILGAILSDVFFGKYRIIIWLSLVYCAGHAALAFMGVTGSAEMWLYLGLFMICVGSGGIKPCVSAHVGDQFGPNNQHLLTKIFNWFYFSINLGAFISSMLTPWLLEWYGPHWAFGVPGVLMGLATLMFWMGRNKFVHIPPSGSTFSTDLFSPAGGKLVLKLLPLYAFVAVFWALFDQTGSSWIFQAQDMDRDFLGMTWLPSQIQAINPIFILILIPVFTLFLYPAISRIFPLTPLRKIGIGLSVMVTAFAIIALIQENISNGGTPNIGWQFLAYVLLTAAEIMVSIVCLEFSYTQAPRSLKSFIMAFYLLAVAAGNLLTSAVNSFIQIPDPVSGEFSAEEYASGTHTLTHPGFDGKAGTADDLSYTVKEGVIKSRTLPKAENFNQATSRIDTWVNEHGQLPGTEKGNELLEGLNDHWGNPIRYRQGNRVTATIISAGPDQQAKTQWDIGTTITLPSPDSKQEKRSWADAFHPSETWLEKQSAKLGATLEKEQESGEEITAKTHFTGGQSKLEGPGYFWFFTLLMGAAAFLFIPYSLLYKYEDHAPSAD